MSIVNKLLVAFMDESQAMSKQGRASWRQGFLDEHWIERRWGALLFAYLFLGQARKSKWTKGIWFINRHGRRSKSNFGFKNYMKIKPSGWHY